MSDPVFRYEIARAVCDDSWPAFGDLPESHKDAICILLGDEIHNPLFPGDIESLDSGESALAQPPEVNLAATNADLMAFFADWLAAEREARGFPEPMRAYDTRSNPDWLRVLNRSREGKTLDDTDRSRLAKARREGRRWGRIVRRVLRGVPPRNY